jgi:flagellar biosynthesis protein FlhA
MMPLPLLTRASRHSDLLLAVALIGIIAVMVVPLPPLLLDLLLALNLAMSLCVLLVATYVTDALQFSVFPSVLLIATLYRLALNISATRLILLHAHAGRVIETFGAFVVGGDYVIGLIVFLILVIIQFVVITNGAQRVAEVAARFTLDEMPGKQLSIDADLNAGIITTDEAKQRRREIEREADFYGAMDGASKFVRGDAIAAIVIIIINIIGGLVIGALRLHMSPLEALETYTLLTVGDGLVSQIPALLISTATGIVVTRAASQNTLGADVLSQLTARPRALLIVAGMLLAFGLIPGLPKISFLLVGGLGAALAYALRRAPQKPKPPQPKPSDQPDDFASLLLVDPIALEIGYGLVGLVDDSLAALTAAPISPSPKDPQALQESGQGGRSPLPLPKGEPARPGEAGGRSTSPLLTRITNIRRQIAQDLGILIPPVRIRDNVELRPNEYVIRLREAIVARGEVIPDQLLAMPTTDDAPPLPGPKGTEPVFGLPAYWIREADRPVAQARGYTVVDASTVIATHLNETLKTHAHEILSRQDVQELVDNLRNSHPALVKELIPDLATLGDVQKVLQGLLREGVPIRDLPTILESIADGARSHATTDEIVELARASLARAITSRFKAADGTLNVLTLSPDLEQQILDAVQQAPARAQPVLAPQATRAIVSAVSQAAECVTLSGQDPVLLVPPKIRAAVRRLLERALPHVAVLSHLELPPDVHIRSVGAVAAHPGDATLPQGALV